MSLVLSIPTTGNQTQKYSFKVQRVQNPHYVHHRSCNVPRELYKAHIKYSRRPPPGLLDLIDLNTRVVETEPDDTTSGAKQKSKVTAIVENNPTDGDRKYLSPMIIGGQKFLMDFDTGSSDLWVRNKDLSRKSALPKGTALFDPSKSSTFQWINGAKFFVTYGGLRSIAVGFVGTDTINIGGAAVTHQAIELPTILSDDLLKDSQNSGIVGLASSSINTNIFPNPQNTFFGNIAPNLKQPVFTADLRHNAPGHYEFGAINETYASKLQYAHIDRTSDLWKFSSTTFVIDGTSHSSDMATAIADTGTSVLHVARNIVDAYYKKVESSTNYRNTNVKVFPCDSKLPDIKLSVGGSLATVRGKTLNYGPTNKDSKLCFGGLQYIERGSDSKNDHMIFGDIFFKDNFVVFDYGNKRIGFAPHV